MNHHIANVGKTCPVCKREIVLHDFKDMDPYTGCSEFCARVPDKDIEAFKNAKPGDFCIFPCAECGEPVEDQWEPNQRNGCLCSKCYPKVLLRERTELLKQAREIINAIPGPTNGPIAALVKQIDEVLS